MRSPHLEQVAALDPDRFTAALHFGVGLATERRPAQGPALAAPRHLDPAEFRHGLGRARRRGDARPATTAEALDAAKRAAMFAPADPNHRARLRRLEPGAALALDVDRAGSRHAPVRSDQGKADEIDPSTSLDQIFIR